MTTTGTTKKPTTPMPVKRVAIHRLRTDPDNARRHDDRNIGAIRSSLERFGQRRPLVVTKANVVIAGNGTLQAARELGWTHLDVTVFPSTDPALIRAFAIADNRTAELAVWDEAVLAAQLQRLEPGDLEAAGWLDKEVAALAPPEATSIVAVDEPSLETEEWRVLEGDVREVLPDLEAESIQCVVTSPPYWNLRDYGTASWVGGSDECDHVERKARNSEKIAAVKGGGRRPEVPGIGYRDTCERCGAVRLDRQIGLEDTPEAYVETIVEVFREIRRVLRPDGVAWLNLGDNYARGSSNPSPKHVARNVGRDRVVANLKPKDLVGVPWMVAFALRDDGWYLRTDVVWHKSNVMPESVEDRPTRCHEFVFMLTRSEDYFYDAEAVAEESADPRGGGLRRNLRDVWTLATGRQKDHYAVFPKELAKIAILAGTSAGGACPVCGSPTRRKIARVGGKTRGRTPANVELARSRGIDRASYGNIRNGDVSEHVTVGWDRRCGHNGDPVPCRVLDPFAGTGTTGVVARELGRSFVGVELNPKDVARARRRKV